MVVIKEEKQAETVVKKSRFIAIARICNSIKDVKAIVDETKAAYPDATHVVHAAVVGNEFSYSDAKEPKNTAGRPALEVLKGSGISNICVLIVRYFGGTLLGTGGLVKAYSDSVKAVLDGLVTEEKIQRDSFSISIPYSLYENVKRLFDLYEVTDIEEKFEDLITLSGLVSANNKEKLGHELAELSNGKLTL